MNISERIEINPAICHGKPVIRGTRVLVCNILGALAGGDSPEQIIEDYPNIDNDDIRAALAFAGELSRFEERSYELATP
ncbi:MAG: DUF433 domain-containing protein [Planctomycetota bacterium]|nr:DUF433 domain-containing protein [Planctomycetota bacterium]MDA1137401.1 DUF433 domain-containing protein [Planctomycetota bacterium]